jgi:hypothetical protein
MMIELRSEGLIRLRTHATRSIAWFIPAWATLCGAIASGGLKLSLSTGTDFVLVLLLVEVGWGTLWTALAATDWATPLRRWRHWRLGDAAVILPYTQPGSPGDRLATWIAQLRAWYQTVLSPAAGPALGSVITGAIISVILSTVVGERVLLLTFAAFSVMELAVLLDRGQGKSPRGWDTILRLGFPWLAGHLAFAAPTLPSLAMATAFTFALTGIGGAREAWGRTFWIAGQLVGAMLFILLGNPLVTPFLAFLIFPQRLLIIWSGARTANALRDWTGQTWPWLMTSMLIAAWAL